MLEFFLLVLTPLVLMDTILLFVVANKMTDGRCWEVSKKVAKWGLVLLVILFGGAVVVTLIVHNWETVKGPLAGVGRVLGLLIGAWAFFMMVKHGIVRPFLEGLRGHR